MFGRSLSASTQTLEYSLSMVLLPKHANHRILLVFREIGASQHDARGIQGFLDEYEVSGIFID